MGSDRIIRLGAITVTTVLPSGIRRTRRDSTMSGILARERSAWIGWEKR